MTVDKDKKFNVWTIKKNDKFFNIQKSEIQWFDSIYEASFFNHNNATLMAQSKSMTDFTIVKISNEGDVI
jgi:hypothetical protein